MMASNKIEDFAKMFGLEVWDKFNLLDNGFVTENSPYIIEDIGIFDADFKPISGYALNDMLDGSYEVEIVDGVNKSTGYIQQILDMLGVEVGQLFALQCGDIFYGPYHFDDELRMIDARGYYETPAYLRYLLTGLWELVKWD